MKFLIAVCSCHKDRDAGCHDSIRRSWAHAATKAKIDVRFFLGGKEPGNLATDETWLNVPDDYNSLPHKTKAIAQWFLLQNYSYLFKCDNDTFVVPERLAKSGFEEADYLGSSVDQVYLHGGVGYFISRRAASILSTSDIGEETAEDRWVGRMLDGKVVKKDAGEKMWRYATWHYPTGMYGHKRYHPDSKWQETMSCAHLDGTGGHDPRGLCFQDRSENGIFDGEYVVVLRIPGHDRPRKMSKTELEYWQQHNLVAKILNPRW